MLSSFIRDVFHAFRLMRRAPLFSFYVIAPLALGIRLNGAIFILVDALLLRPLPVRNPNELVRLVEVIQNLGPRGNYTYNAVEALQKKSTSFSDVIGYSDQNAALRDASGVSRVRCQVVTGNFFTALGVQALRGRVLNPSDAFAVAAAPAVVLSYPYWHHQLGGDPNAVGRVITLGDHPFIVVGVMPQYFNGLELETTPDIRAPLMAASLLSRGNPDAASFRKLEYSIAARMRPGVTFEQARTESEQIVNASMDLQSGKLLRDEHLEVQPAGKGVSLLRPKFSAGLILLMTGVGLLLIMICANVAGLLLARASGRRAEMSVRLALGASRGTLLRQWLTEALVLTGMGGLAGMGVAFLSAPLFIRALPAVRDISATVLTLSFDLGPDR